MNRSYKKPLPYPSMERRDALVAHHLKSAPPVAYLYDSYFFEAGLAERNLQLSVGYDNMIAGRIFDTAERPAVEVDHFAVARSLRGKGIGERLLKGFVAIAKTEGVIDMFSDSVSNAALSLRRRVFGDEALHFYDGDELAEGELYRPARRLLPMAVDQAYASNIMIEQSWSNAPNGTPVPGHFGIYVDLSSIDTSDWPTVYASDINLQNA